jgi:copper oxidase (laccase) domain-containing protein
VVRAKSCWATIHAGWRGLACGIISAALAHVEDPLEAAIFASAGGEAYEVGREVIDAIGSSAVYRETPDGRYLLDTAATAANQVQAGVPHLPVEISGVCTISDSRFHSFRRQAESCGRSVTFVVPAG